MDLDELNLAIVSKELKLSQGLLGALIGIEYESAYKNESANRKQGRRITHSKRQQLWLLFSDPGYGIPFMLQYWFKLGPKNCSQVKNLRIVARTFLPPEEVGEWERNMLSEYPEFIHVLR